MTNVAFNPELVQRKVAPPLEVVTHGGRNWKLCVLEFVALEISLDFLIFENLLNLSQPSCNIHNHPCRNTCNLSSKQELCESHPT